MGETNSGNDPRLSVVEDKWAESAYTVHDGVAVTERVKGVAFVIGPWTELRVLQSQPRVRLSVAPVYESGRCCLTFTKSLIITNPSCRLLHWSYPTLAQAVKLTLSWPTIVPPCLRISTATYPTMFSRCVNTGYSESLVAYILTALWFVRQEHH